MRYAIALSAVLILAPVSYSGGPMQQEPQQQIRREPQPTFVDKLTDRAEAVTALTVAVGSILALLERRRRRNKD